MSKGVLIFAINSTFDYVAAATEAARRVKKYLDLPVTLVTEQPVDSKYFDQVILLKNNTSTARHIVTATGKMNVRWFNESQVRAYELSPYDQTLLMDADYFMFNDSLGKLFDTNLDFACWENVNDLAEMKTTPARLNTISIPMVWATVTYFTKGEFAKSVYGFMQVIKDNWDYYSYLYHFDNHNFRNDYALSIALQALSGYSTKNFNRIPGKLHTIFSEADVLSVTDDTVVFSKDNKVNKVINTNVHCINKLAMEKFYA